MSTVTICYPNMIRERSASHVGLSFILISFVLIASAILIIVVSANANRMGGPGVRRSAFDHGCSCSNAMIRAHH
jgi:hypothetical protein